MHVCMHEAGPAACVALVRRCSRTACQIGRGAVRGSRAGLLRACAQPVGMTACLHVCGRCACAQLCVAHVQLRASQLLHLKAHAVVRNGPDPSATPPPPPAGAC